MIVLQKDLILKNRYKLVKSLGQGGLSSVWLAEDIKLEILVALKFLNESLINDINHIKNFSNEWKIAHNLIHPNIIKVYEYHADTTIPFYAMQYIDGYEISILSNISSPIDLVVTFLFKLQLLTFAEIFPLGKSTDFKLLMRLLHKFTSSKET